MLFIVETVFKKLLAVLLVAAVFITVVPGSSTAAAKEMGIVTAAQLNIRARPDRTSRAISTLTKNKIVTVVSHTNNGWLKVDYKGLVGFIRNRERYVRLYKEKKKQKIKRAVTVPFYEAPSAEPNVTTEKAPTEIEKKIEGHQKEIRKIDKELKETRKEVYRFTKKEKTILNGLNEIEISLNNARKKLSRIKKEIRTLDIEIRTNNLALKDLRTVIRVNGRYIEKRLVSLYKLNRLGQMNVLASSDSIYDFLSRKNGMEKILEADEKILKNHIDNLERLSDLQNRLSEQKGTKIALKNDYRSQIDLIEQKKSRKKSLLSEIRSKKSLKQAAIESLKRAAEELTQTITALDQGFGSFSTAGGATGSFVAKKGEMRVPVKGQVINHFGKAKDEKFFIETFHSGIKIKADRGEPIQAVSNGKVIFADWLKGYGNLIIIDHGEHYYSLYGHTEELFKSKGDAVEDREVIATVGDTGALDGAGLHFEIRHKGEPVAPLTWLKKDKY